MREALKPETELGFHGHHNLAMGVANSIAAIEVRRQPHRRPLRPGWGGAGNTPMEVLVAVLDRMGIETGVDVFKIRTWPRTAWCRSWTIRCASTATR